MRTMTPEEREAQRRSFAYGNANLANPDVTRAMVDEAAATMNVQTLNLERIPLAISMEVAQQYPELAGAKLDAQLDHVRRTMAFKLRRYILALPDQRISHPADWWQALRARWFPSWWLRRHPIRCEEVHGVPRRVPASEIRGARRVRALVLHRDGAQLMTGWWAAARSGFAAARTFERLAKVLRRRPTVHYGHGTLPPGAAEVYSHLIAHGVNVHALLLPGETWATGSFRIMGEVIAERDILLRREEKRRAWKATHFAELYGGGLTSRHEFKRFQHLDFAAAEKRMVARIARADDAADSIAWMTGPLYTGANQPEKETAVSVSAPKDRKFYTEHREAAVTAATWWGKAYHALCKVVDPPHPGDGIGGGDYGDAASRAILELDRRIQSDARTIAQQAEERDVAQRHVRELEQELKTKVAMLDRARTDDNRIAEALGEDRTSISFSPLGKDRVAWILTRISALTIERDSMREQRDRERELSSTYRAQAVRARDERDAVIQDRDRVFRQLDRAERALSAMPDEAPEQTVLEQESDPTLGAIRADVAAIRETLDPGAKPLGCKRLADRITGALSTLPAWAGNARARAQLERITAELRSGPNHAGDLRNYAKLLREMAGMKWIQSPGCGGPTFLGVAAGLESIADGRAS